MFIIYFIEIETTTNRIALTFRYVHIIAMQRRYFILA